MALPRAGFKHGGEVGSLFIEVGNANVDDIATSKSYNSQLNEKICYYIYSIL